MRWLALLVLLPNLAFAQFGGAFGGSSSGVGQTSDLVVKSLRTVDMRMSRVRCQLWTYYGSTTLASTCGWTLGLYGSAAVETTSIETNRTWFRYTSGAVSGDDAGPSGEGQYNGRMLLRVYVRWRAPTTLTSIRSWVGIISSNMPDTSTGTGSGARGAAFRFATDVPDTNFQACSGNNGGSYSCTDTGVAPVAGTIYEMDVDCSTKVACVYKLNGTTVATRTTNIPTDDTSTANVGPGAIVTTLTAAARSHWVNQIVVEWQ